MQDFERHKSNFFSFMETFGPKEKIAILSHQNCVDGMASAVFLVEIIKKKCPSLPSPTVMFLPYKIGCLENLEEQLKKKKIAKVFVLDVNLDVNLLEEFERFREKFDVCFIDHHPLNPKLRMDEKTIKTHTDDCTSLTLYRFGEGLIDEKRWSWLACVAAVSEFSYKNEDNLKFIQMQYPSFKVEEKNSEVWALVDKLGSLIIYYSSDSLKAYEVIVKRDFEKIEVIHSEVSAEMERNLKDFEDNAESLYSKQLYFYLITSRFDLGSKMSTLLSVRHKGSTVILFSETEGTNLIRVSTRNNGTPLRYTMPDLLRAGIAGLQNAIGGGHAPAAGGSFLRKDLATFKERVKAFVKAKIK